MHRGHLQSVSVWTLEWSGSASLRAVKPNSDATPVYSACPLYKAYQQVDEEAQGPHPDLVTSQGRSFGGFLSPEVSILMPLHVLFKFKVAPSRPCIRRHFKLHGTTACLLRTFMDGSDEWGLGMSAAMSWCSLRSKGSMRGWELQAAPPPLCPAMMLSESLPGNLNGQIHLFARDRL